MANQTDRVLELIKRFNNNEIVCIKQLQNEEMWYEKSEKTIRRDLDIIKKHFPNSFHLVKGATGCYKAITNSLFENIVNPKTMTMLIQTFNIANRSKILKTLNISKEEKTILESKIKEHSNIYDFKTTAIEKENDFEKFKTLERAIKYQKILNIKYNSLTNQTENFIIKPYKILFMNGNFYLACEVIDRDFEFSLFRISRIKKIIETPKTFNQKTIIKDFIKEINTPFPKFSDNFRENLITIKIEANKSIAKYFKEKKFFKSQNIEELENGNLIITYKMTQTLEIKNFIKQWIPNIKIIEPKSLYDEIKKEIREFLD